MQTFAPRRPATGSSPYRTITRSTSCSSSTRCWGSAARRSGRHAIGPGARRDERCMTRALIFDLDGTLIDTVYAHVFAWQQALAGGGRSLEGWRINRRIGMSGVLFTRAVAREVGRPLSDAEVEQIQ